MEITQFFKSAETSQLAFTGVAVIASWWLLTKLFSRGTPVKGAVILVTGASEGVGEALSIALVEKGAKVLMLARNKEKLTKIQNQLNIKFPNMAFIYPVDCSDHKAVDEIANTIIRNHGAPNVIVNNAGAGKFRFLHEMSGEEIKECLNAPFLAAAFITRAFLKEMIKRNSGAILNVCSPAGFAPWAGATAYVCSRFALRGLSEALTMDLYSTNIKVQDIILAHVQSNYFSNNPGSVERLPILDKFLLQLSPEAAAKCIIKQIESGERVTVHRFDMRFAFWLRSWMPSLMSWLVCIMGYNQIKKSV